MKQIFLNISDILNDNLDAIFEQLQKWHISRVGEKGQKSN